MTMQGYSAELFLGGGQFLERSMARVVMVNVMDQMAEPFNWHELEENVRQFTGLHTKPVHGALLELIDEGQIVYGDDGLRRRQEAIAPHDS